MTTPLLVSLAAFMAVAFAVLGASKIRAVPSMQARAAHDGVAEMAPALVVSVLLVAYLWLAFGNI